MNNLDVARQVVAFARGAGADQCDAMLVAFDESSVTVRFGEAEKLIEAGSRTLGLRVINGGRTAVCSTSDLEEGALQQFATDTVALARIAEPDPAAGLPEPAQLATRPRDDLRLYDEQIAALDTEARLALAMSCEAAALGADTRITNTDGATFTSRVAELSLANSHGFASSHPLTSASLAVEVMADDAEGKKRNAHWYTSGRSLSRLQDAEEVGRIAARRAVDQIGARKVPTARVPVIFEPMMAASLLRDVASCITGGALYRQATFLAGRLGESIGSPLVTIDDDPLLPGGSASRPFDGEGVTTGARRIFDAGRFEAFLFDVYTARRTGNVTTGSASRGVDSLPSPSISNFILRPGVDDPEALLSGIPEGLYVTALLGQGFNPTTGDYSRGAGGFWIENGRLAYPVTEINISGALAGILGGVEGLGNDLTWFGGMAAPTVRVREMTVSGL